MPELNASEAARLYGKSRMTIHRHCRSGRVTSRISHDGQRLIDLSELIRAYGEPPTPVTPDTPHQASQRYTPRDTHHNERDDLLLRELQALRKQVTQLQEEVSQLRRLPAPGHLQSDHAEDSPAEVETTEPTAKQVTGFGDLLKRFQDRNS